MDTFAKRTNLPRGGLDHTAGPVPSFFYSVMYQLNPSSFGGLHRTSPASPPPLPYLFRHTYFLHLKPNATSALEGKMVHNDPNPRYSGQMASGVLYFVTPGNAHGKKMEFECENKSTYL